MTSMSPTPQPPAVHGPCFTPPWPIGYTVFPRIAPLVKMRVVGYSFDDVDGSHVQVKTRWVIDGSANS